MRGTYPYEELFEKMAMCFRAGTREGLVILEIGVRKGFSTRYFLSGLEKRQKRKRGGKLYSIDIAECKKANKIFPKNNWQFIHGDSKKVPWNKQIDILYIDGDHSYEGVKADFEKYEPFVRKDGLILIHDTLLNQGVWKFWQKIKCPKANLNLNYAGLGVVNKI